jgi:hypothetical protein
MNATRYPSDCSFLDWVKFWSQVDRSGEHWLWHGGVKSDGYGLFCTESTRFIASRFAWMFPYPEEREPVYLDDLLGARVSVREGDLRLYVCHSCDIPLCMRPCHLWLGTSAENLQDMHHKGRAGDPARKGENNGNAKLTWDVVRSIRERVAAGERQKTIALEFGVTPTQISGIVHHRSWVS